ncbi:MAG: thioredoxin family protein [Fimbriimonadales bacterium]|nr:thioredoxin family protein [Fimbriimonadales bacterium]
MTVAIPAGYHAYSNPPSSPDYIPLTISTGDGTELASVRYPRGQMKVFEAISPEPASVYEGTQRIPVEIKIPGEASGNHVVNLRVRIQMCDDTACYMPQTETISATIAVSKPTNSTPPPTKVDEPPAKADEKKPDKEPEVVANQQEEQAGQAEPEGDPTDSAQETESTAVAPEGGYPSRASELPSSGAAGPVSAAFIALLLGAFIAGLSLNLTPCVYPLIPITLSFFSSQAGSQGGSKLGLGTMYALGIALSFGILGAVSSLLGAGFGALAQTPTFNLLMAALLVALSLSMFGLYEIKLPGFIQKQLKGRSGGVGAFTMGSLLGLAAAPCGTAIIAYFITEVAKDGRLEFGVPIFVAMGLGLGLPYVFLAAAGAQLPRSAEWLVSVKRILGLIVVLLAFDRFLRPSLVGFGVMDEIALGITVGAFIVGAAYLTFFDRSFSSKIVAGIRTITIIGSVAYGMLLYADLDAKLKENRFKAIEKQLQQEVNRKIAWQPFTVDAFEKAVGQGKPVIVDGTANWCAACQEIEHKTLSDPRVIVSMRDVVAFKMDASTGVDDAYIEATQKHFGWKSLPHIRFYNPSGELVHIQLEFINVDGWLDILEKSGVAVIR